MHDLNFLFALQFTSCSHIPYLTGSWQQPGANTHFTDMKLPNRAIDLSEVTASGWQWGEEGVVTHLPVRQRVMSVTHPTLSWKVWNLKGHRL